MYHALVLEDVLDLIGLAALYPDVLAEPVTSLGLAGTAARMTDWLRQILHPDGDIPFFNDAAFGTAATPAQLFAYAAARGVSPSLKKEGSDRPELGLARVRMFRTRKWQTCDLRGDPEGSQTEFATPSASPGSRPRPPTPDQVRGRLPDQVRGRLPDQVRGRLPDQVRGRLPDQVRSRLPEQVRGRLSPFQG